MVPFELCYYLPGNDGSGCLERLRLWDGSVCCDCLVLVRLLLGQAVGDWGGYYFAKCRISVDEAKLWNALVTLAAFEIKLQQIIAFPSPLCATCPRLLVVAIIASILKHRAKLMIITSVAIENATVDTSWNFEGRSAEHLRSILFLEACNSCLLSQRKNASYLRKSNLSGRSHQSIEFLQCSAKCCKSMFSGLEVWTTDTTAFLCILVYSPNTPACMTPSSFSLPRELRNKVWPHDS